MPRVNGGQERKNKQAVKEQQRDGGEKEERRRREGDIQSRRLLYRLCMLCLLPWKQTWVSSRPAEQGKPRRSDRGVPIPAFLPHLLPTPLPWEPFSVLFLLYRCVGTSRRGGGRGVLLFFQMLPM